MLKIHHRVFLPIIFISIAISFVTEYINKESAFATITIVATMFGILADLIIALGLVKIGLKITAGEPIAFDDIFSATHLFFSYIGALILYMLIVIGGFLLLIVPGLLWLASYWLFPYVLVDKENGIFAALLEAKRISKGARWHICLFMLVSGILNIAGALIFLVGLFITIPLTSSATAYIYRILQKRAEPELIPEQAKIPLPESMPASQERVRV